MAVVPDQFERVADTVMERTSELLGARVTVVDASGTVITSSEPGMEGLHIVPQEEDDGYLRVPLHLHNARGEVLIQYGGGEVISPRLARVMAELIINQAAVVDRLPNKLELKNKFIHDLLHGGEGDDGSILREAQILGMDLSAPRLVMLIDASHYILDGHGRDASEAIVRRRSQLIIGSVVDFFQLPNDTICAYIGEGEVAILKASSSSALGDWAGGEGEPAPLSPSWANLTALKRASAALLTRLRNDTRCSVSLGIGRYHPGISGLSRSYSDARAALLLGRRFHGQNRVHCLDGLGIAAFVGVSDEATKIDLATHLLSPITHEPDLLETLECFFAHDCSPSSTALSLSIHRNTLAYRLDKITLLTGLDPRRFDDAVQMRLALTLSALPADEVVQMPN